MALTTDLKPARAWSLCTRDTDATLRTRTSLSSAVTVNKSWNESSRVVRMTKFLHYAVETGGMKKRKDLLTMCRCNERIEGDLCDIVVKVRRYEETGSVIVVTSDATDIMIAGNNGRRGGDFLVNSKTNGDVASCERRDEKEAMMLIHLKCFMIGWSECGDVKLCG